MKPPAADDERPLRRGEDDLPLVEALDLHHARHAQPPPPVERQLVRRLERLVLRSRHTGLLSAFGFPIPISMRTGRALFFSRQNFAVHADGVVLADGLGDLQHLDRERALAELDFDFVPDLHVVGRLGRAAVDRDAGIVAGLVGDGAPLDEPRDLEIFVQTHKTPPVNKLIFRREVPEPPIQCAVGVDPLSARGNARNFALARRERS